MGTERKKMTLEGSSMKGGLLVKWAATGEHVSLSRHNDLPYSQTGQCCYFMAVFHCLQIVGEQGKGNYSEQTKDIKTPYPKSQVQNKRPKGNWRSSGISKERNKVRPTSSIKCTWSFPCLCELSLCQLHAPYVPLRPNLYRKNPKNLK